MMPLREWWVDLPFWTATPTDLVDVALLAVLFYRLFVVMQGTRAMQSLLGLALAAGLYVASDVLNLAATHWVLDGLFVYVVLALLILFQEDVRRVLARVGGTLASAGIQSQEQDAATLEEVVRATFSLAQRKIGALVLVERTASLEPWAESGHALGAVVSAELLVSLFHPSSPLHDGAVLLRGSRVVAAGIFLPVNTSRDVGRAVGTRHRAALAISELTDALCVVASEERGTVTVVVGGELTPVADANDLRRVLSEQMTKALPEARRA